MTTDLFVNCVVDYVNNYINMSNVLSSLEGTALASRLIRLGEIIRRDVAMIYEHEHLDWEPKWSPILLVLMNRSPLGVQELADELGYTHPSIIALVNEMEKKKLIKSSVDKTDKRRRLVSLTPKAFNIKKEMQPTCDVMDEIVIDITNNKHNLITALNSVEEVLSAQSFFQRYCSKTDK